MTANESEAEAHLLALQLPVLSDENIAQWNDAKNRNFGFDRDIVLTGWHDEDGHLTKEFYVRDPTGESYGLYRKAWYVDYNDTGTPELILTDADRNELDLTREARLERTDDDQSLGM